MSSENLAEEAIEPPTRGFSVSAPKIQLTENQLILNAYRQRLTRA